nr:MAG TPA: hypothetical protein [Caudoviricetes sp.]
MPSHHSRLSHKNLSPTYHQLKRLIMMNFGSSPLLDYNQQAQPSQQIDGELQKLMEAINQKRACINMQVNQSKTPLWDEIDKIEDSLTGAQRQYLMQNQEYAESLQYVTKLIQDEELRIIRPRIETTQQGQEALKRHLSLMQHLKKEATQVEEQKNALRDEYFEHYADKMNYAEFISMKQGKKGGAKK